MKKREVPTKKVQVTFTLEVPADDSTEAVEEAVTTLIDEEIGSHRDGGTRCGVRFYDAVHFEVHPE